MDKISFLTKPKILIMIFFVYKTIRQPAANRSLHRIEFPLQPLPILSLAKFCLLFELSISHPRSMVDILKTVIYLWAFDRPSQPCSMVDIKATSRRKQHSLEMLWLLTFPMGDMQARQKRLIDVFFFSTNQKFPSALSDQTIQKTIWWFSSRRDLKASPPHSPHGFTVPLPNLCAR